MKKFLRRAAASLLALVAFAPAFAQMPGQMPQLPVDNAVLSGTLPNGLTYYIRHNENPKGQADFYIAQKVGSVLEEENQRGLAHFLEHMCFNGTTHYPGNSLISYLESIGVKFGAQLNAQTGTDATTYMITNVPTARTEVTDSVLLILHDWANDLTLDPEEIDKERGVIHEEWRTTSVGTMRILENLLPTIYPGSKYGERLPIGTLEVIDNFPPQAIRDYYETWYRPDLQGIIVIGDVDVARTEEVIKKMFGDIEMPAGAPARPVVEVPDTPGTIYAVGSDKEQSNAIVYLMIKQDVLPMELRNTQVALLMDYIKMAIDGMLNARFQEMMSKPDTPFAVAQAGIENYMLSNSKEMLALIGVAKGNDIMPTIQSIYRELLRAKRGGFTSTEYDRVRSEYLASLEAAYNNRNDMENGAYSQDMIDHFLNGTYLLGIENEYQVMQQLAQMIDVNTINAAFAEMVTDDNRVVLCMLPEAAKIPTEAQLAEMMKAVDAEEIEVFSDNVRTDPLIPSLPAPGTIVSESTLPGFEGVQVWTLSNGAKVYAKKTPFKADEIIMAAYAPGGISPIVKQFKPADVLSADAFVEGFGIGAYNHSDLNKYLAGKKASFQPGFSLYQASASGYATPKDLPTLMELIYGYYTSANIPEEDFEATRSQLVGALQNQEANPQFIFQRDLMKALYNTPYTQALTADDVKNASRDEILKMMQTPVADASQWSFVFTGNFDEAQLRQLAEQYLATLPSTGKGGKRSLVMNPEFEMKGGKLQSNFTTKMETPQTWCAIVESGSMPFNSKNAKMTAIVGQILTARLLKSIREEMGAVYSIGAYGNIEEQEGRNTNIMTAFPMNPELKEQVLASIAGEFEAMANEITAEELNKVKEYMVKSYTERREQNEPWATYIGQWILTGQDLFNNAVEEVNAITPADIQNYVRALNAQGNYHVIILDPEQ